MPIKSRAMALTSAVLIAAAGATLAAAPAASAVSIPSQCQYQWNEPRNARTTTDVNLRTGPSTSYTSIGLLTTGTGFTHYCLAYPNGNNWAWGKVTSGANAGRAGWVYYNYLNF
ncbi:SH3 domain-containing protein [Streptomyces xanthochromogenes]|uniref:SH3 domain-containing protein n=1 Tax=Streptomyces xanthochromogenes TaxID=67384 RepID=UPI00380FAB2E